MILVFSESSEAVQESLEKIGLENYIKELHPVVLRTLDRLWTDHLEGMNNVRQSVQLRAYGQKEPFCSYIERFRACRWTYSYCNFRELPTRGWICYDP